MNPLGGQAGIRFRCFELRILFAHHGIVLGHYFSLRVGQGIERLDLRAVRLEIDERCPQDIVDSLDAALDHAAGSGESSLVLIHGLGTGALRDALRRHLARINRETVAVVNGNPRIVRGPLRDDTTIIALRRVPIGEKADG